MPLYASSALTFSRTGNRLGMIVANAEGFHLYLQDIDTETHAPGAPREVYSSKRIVRGPVLSSNGEIVVIGSSDRSGSLELSLLALDAATGRQIGELWDGAQTGMATFMFSPLARDFRLLATSNRSGVHRPFLWNPLTGERTNLQLDELEGEILPVDWSADGQRLLLVQFSQAVQRLYLYDVEARMKALGKPIEVQWFDSGHLSFSDVEQAINHYESMLAFAYKVLHPTG